MWIFILFVPNSIVSVLRHNYIIYIYIYWFVNGAKDNNNNNNIKILI